MKLAKLADVKSYMSKTDNADDVLLELILSHVSSRIELAMNRQLLRAQRTKVFDGGHRFYFLPAYPIDTTTSPTNYAPVVTVEGATKTPNSDYYIWAEQGMIEFYQPPMKNRPQGISITWYGGYTEIMTTDDPPVGTGVLNVPEPMTRAAILQTVFEFKRRKDIGLTHVGMPDGSIDTLAPMEFLKDVQAIVSAYRGTNV